MEELPPPDSHIVRAALGWFELGNRLEAQAELAQVSETNQNHPATLEVRWLLCADTEDWDAALLVARELLARVPERPDSWLHHAYALRRAVTGGLAAARAALEPAADKFPEEPVIPYNISCYACQMEELEVARLWLQRAMVVGKKADIKRMALADADLAPLWSEIQTW